MGEGPGRQDERFRAGRESGGCYSAIRIVVRREHAPFTILSFIASEWKCGRVHTTGNARDVFG